MLQSLLPQPPINPTSSSSSGAAPANSKRPSPDFPPDKKPRLSDPSAGAGATAGAGENEEESRIIRVLSLLLRCAESIAVDDLGHALTLLPEISSLSSPFGSSPERVAAHFADALRARILSSLLGAYSPLPPQTLTLTLTLTRRISRSLQTLNSISPLLKFSHFTSNQAIFQSLAGHDRVHILDLDVTNGLQWPGLFNILSARRPRPILSIRLTAFGPAAETLASTGRTLADFAAALKIPFDFTPIEGKITDLADLDLAPLRRTDHSEAVAVHWTQHCLYDATGSDESAARIVRSICPNVVTIVEQDLGYKGGFLPRFVEALQYYSALFDAVGEGGGGGEDRWEVERGVLAGEIRNIVAVGGPKRTGEVRLESWGEELRRCGFRQVSLAGTAAAAQARLLLGMGPWKGYTLVEENGRLRLGWKDLSLLTASAWRPAGAGEEEDWDTSESPVM